MDSYSLEEIENQVIVEVQKTAIGTIDKLFDVMLTLYDVPAIKTKMRDFPIKINVIFESILKKFQDKETFYKNKLKELQEQALSLSKILNIELPNIDNDGGDRRMPLVVLITKLTKIIEELEENKKERKEEFHKLQMKQKNLCDLLDEPPIEFNDDILPNKDDLEEFRNYINKLEEEKIKRTEEIRNLRREIKSLVRNLEINDQPPDETQLLANENIQPTSDNLSKLNEIYKFYCRQNNEIKDSIDKIKMKLNRAWDLMNIDQDFRDKFLQNANYTRNTLEELQLELDRCEYVKKQNAKILIRKLKSQLDFWEKKCMVTTKLDKQISFSNINDENLDEVFDIFERNIRDLEYFYNNNISIFSLLEKRIELLDKLDELDHFTIGNLNRLYNRGGHLLQEERDRKSIAKKLAFIEQELCSLLEKYEEQNKRKFCVYGENVIDWMQKQWNGRKLLKKKFTTNSSKQGNSNSNSNSNPLYYNR